MDVLGAVINGTLTGDDATRNQAETRLFELQRLPGFMSGLCTMVVSGPTYAVKLGAAIALSNTVVRNWTRTADKVAHARDAVLAASDKEVVRNNIIELAMGVDAKPILKTVAEAITHICHSDFPDNWPGFLVALEANLKRVEELQRVHNVLVILRRVSKKYEFCERARWGPMIMISDRLMPLLRMLLETLLPSPLPVAATLIKFIAKVFYSVTVYQVAGFTQNEHEVVAWFGLLNKVLCRQLHEPSEGKEPAQPASLEAREEWVWWKTKRRVALVFCSVMDRFGNVKKIPASNTADRTFSQLFRTHVVAQVFPSVLGLITAKFKHGAFVSKKCLAHLISFLEACVPTKAYTLLKPNLGFILQSVIAPLCGFTDEDQELWVDDPHEFVRMQYNPQKDQQSPRDMAEQLLCTLVAKRPKATMQMLEAFWTQVLNAHATTPNYRAKDGVLCMFGTIKTSLVDTAFFQAWEHKVEPFLTSAVLPEFDAPDSAPYLRAHACWAYSQYADSIEFENEALLGTAAVKIVECLAPTQPLPVQFTAAASLWFIAQSDSEAVGKVMASNITMVVGQLLRIMNEVPVDDVVSSLDALISKFGEGIAVHAAGLVQKLTVLWRQFASEGEDGDDEAALSSEHCLQCISSLLPLSDGDAAMFRELQAALMPVLSVAFDTTAKRVEQLDGAIDLFYLMARYSPQPFDEVMWHAFGAMVNAFFTFADDYIAHITGPIGYLIARDTEAFLAGSTAGTSRLNVVAKIVNHVVNVRKSSEPERRDAMCLLYMVMHQCPGRVDDFVRGALTLVTAELASSRTSDYKVQLAAVVLSGFVYNAPLCIKFLAGAGTLGNVMAALFGIMPTFVTSLQHRVGALGLCAVLCMPSAELPDVLSGNLAALLGLTLRMLDTLAGQGKAGGDEGKADDDVAGADDFEDLGDDEDFADGREEAWAAALGKLGAAAAKVQGAMAAGEALPDDFDYEDFVDDDEDAYEDDEEQDANYVSPLDDMDPFTIFKATVQALGATPAGAAAYNGLDAEQRAKCTAYTTGAAPTGAAGGSPTRGPAVGAGAGAGAGAGSR